MAQAIRQAGGLGRPRTKLTLGQEEKARLKEQICAAKDPRDKERLPVVHWATSGHHTLAQLAVLTDRARSTIQAWLAAYPADGREQLLARRAPPAPPPLPQISPFFGGKMSLPLFAAIIVLPCLLPAA